MRGGGAYPCSCIGRSLYTGRVIVLMKGFRLRGGCTLVFADFVRCCGSSADTGGSQASWEMRDCCAGLSEAWMGRGVGREDHLFRGRTGISIVPLMYRKIASSCRGGDYPRTSSDRPHTPRYSIDRAYWTSVHAAAPVRIVNGECPGLGEADLDGGWVKGSVY